MAISYTSAKLRPSPPCTNASYDDEPAIQSRSRSRVSVQRDNPVHHPLTHIQSFTHPFSPSRRPTGINANVETGSDKENGVVSRPKAPLEPVVRHLWSPIGKLQRHCGGRPTVDCVPSVVTARSSSTTNTIFSFNTNSHRHHHHHHHHHYHRHHHPNPPR